MKINPQRDCWEFPCKGCKNPHPSFWKTITQSKIWEKWYKEQMKRMENCKCFDSVDRCTCTIFDIDESQECGNLSENHWEAFMDFCKKT